MKKENKHKGSTFDSFLEEEGIYESVEKEAKRRDSKKEKLRQLSEDYVPTIPSDIQDEIQDEIQERKDVITEMTHDLYESFGKECADKKISLDDHINIVGNFFVLCVMNASISIIDRFNDHKEMMEFIKGDITNSIHKIVDYHDENIKANFDKFKDIK